MFAPPFIVHCTALRCTIDNISDNPNAWMATPETMARQDATTQALQPHHIVQYGGSLKTQRSNILHTH